MRNKIKSVLVAVLLASSLTACGVDDGELGDQASALSATDEVEPDAPLPLSATTCGAMCFSVDGSGNHVNRVGVSLSSNPAIVITNSGHLQARWHAGGVDHFRNSTEGFISNQGTAWLTMNVNVDPNTFVCGRWWHWNGSSWILPYGDWRCIKTHP